jgi:DnaJ-class molecular chaperone
MAEPTTQPEPPQPCGACGGSGSVISNIGGTPHAVSCPWCDGGGTFLADHDAQAHWKQENEPPA